MHLLRLVLASLLVAHPLPGQSDTNGTTHLLFLDIGQADAVLIRSPEGKTALIDAALSSIAQQVRSYSVDTIDLAIASHPHADHIGGMAEEGRTTACPTPRAPTAT